MAAALRDSAAVVQRVFDHIDNRTTDQSEATWREPVANYRTESRLAAEIERVLRRETIAFCPSAALAEAGSYVAREAAGTPILAVRGIDGVARAFRNACRHRGTQLADGIGCTKALVCRYHGWTYGLDGALRHVPHEHGFPGLDKSTRGLVPLPVVERGGLVFVAQAGSEARLPDDMPDLLPPGLTLFSSSAQEQAANWKVLAEGFLEGYHIRSTHSETFFPVQYDNLNVVESFGRNSRVTFPYRSIKKLRSVAPAERRADGVLTYVYHLFPNVMVATFPAHYVMAVLEPLTIDRTRLVNYTLARAGARGPDAKLTPERGTDFVQMGAVEDRAMALAVQRGLASGANECVEFGRFEGAITHFHRNLHAALDDGV